MPAEASAIKMTDSRAFAREMSRFGIVLQSYNNAVLSGLPKCSAWHRPALRLVVNEIFTELAIF